MRTLLVMVALATALVVSCSDDGEPKADSNPPDAAPAEGGAPDLVTHEAALTDASVDQGATDGATPVTFAGAVQPILSASCASGSCHGGANPQEGMSLETGKAYAALVGVQSGQCASLKRVEAGDASKSYLIQKLEGSGSCFTGLQMPVGGALDSAKLATIRAWIDQGALDN